MPTPQQIRGSAPADLPLILQDMLDQIESLRAAAADRRTIADLEDEVRQLHALRGR